MKTKTYFIFTVFILFSFFLVTQQACKKDEKTNNPPTCKITAPKNGQEIVKGETVTIYADANDSDGNITEVRFFIDGVGIGAATSFPYNYIWNTSTESTGNHTIKATCLDNNSGNSSDEITIKILQLDLPVSDFSASPTNGQAPLTVTFTDQSSNNPTSWFWEFGDGESSTLQHPVYTYDISGTFSVSLRVENNNGFDIKYKQDYITVSNSPTEILVIDDGFRPHLSPDGSSIVFLRLHASSVPGQDQSEIWSVNIDGTGLTRLTNTIDQCEYSPQWHPDGNTIAFIRSSSTNYYLNESGKIMEMSKTGTNQIVILESNWKTKDFCFYPRNNNLYLVLS